MTRNAMKGLPLEDLSELKAFAINLQNNTPEEVLELESKCDEWWERFGEIIQSTADFTPDEFDELNAFIEAVKAGCTLSNEEFHEQYIAKRETEKAVCGRRIAGAAKNLVSFPRSDFRAVTSPMGSKVSAEMPERILGELHCRSCEKPRQLSPKRF
jgi:hypothetical protein